MKTYLVLATFLILAATSIAQNNENTPETSDVLIQKWRVNFVIGSESFQEKLMQKNIVLTATTESPFGDFLELKPDGTFVSYNQGPCGNECRVRVYGNYIRNTDKEIEIIIDRVEYHKMCMETPPKKVNESFGVYAIETNENGFVLSRVESN